MHQFSMVFMRWSPLLLILLAIPAANAIVINEIMYDPAGSDAGREWVEIYNNESFEVNLLGWKFFEEGTNHGLTLANGSWTLPAGSFAIIADNYTKFLLDYSDFNDTLFDSIFSLSNFGESIALKNSSLFALEIINYGAMSDASGNGNSLQRVSSGRPWNSSNIFARPATPGAQNFFEHEISLKLEQTNTNEITAHLANNGLSDENITLELFIDGNISGENELALASFDSGDVTFVLENLTAGEHVALVDATFSGGAVSAESNFSTALPNADVYLEIEINQSTDEYLITAYPENSSLSAEVFVMPIGVEGADGFTSGYDLDSENDWIDAYSDIIDPEIDFGTYDLCAEILEITNYNDTNLENNFVCQNFTIAPPASQTRTRIKTFVEYDMYALNQTLFWTAQLFPLSPGTAGNLTISLQKKGTQSTTELLKIENYNLTENIILSSNFTIPEDWIEGIYKVRAKFKYSEKYLDSRDSGQFWLAGLKDLGQANITILKTPTYLSFGGFGTTVVKFFAGNYNYDKLRFLVYGYPSQVLIDLDGKGLTASSSDAAVAVDIPDVRRGESYYLALPEFAKQNCENQYKSENYRIRVRAFKPVGSGWEELATTDYQLPFSNRVGAFCPEAPKKERVSLAGLQLQKQKTVSDVLDLSVFDAPEKVTAGDSFTLEVEVENKQNTTKKFQVYSHIYSGKNVFTEGGWTGNAQTIELDGLTSKKILLDNVVKEDTVSGRHVLRVRAKVDGKDVDWDSEIEIVAPEQSAEGTLAVGGAGPSSITGAAVLWRSEKAGNLSVAALAVIAILLILVVVLIKAHK